MDKIYEIEGGINSVKGIYSAGVCCGLKEGKEDLALIYSEKISDAVGVFTTNAFQAAPVLVTQEHLKQKRAQAIIINSGNANACTGKIGFDNANQMAQLTASALNLPTESVLVASTGMIGKQLPMGKISSGIKKAADNLNRLSTDTTARAIMTTDTFPKEIAIEMELSSERKARLAGIAKGSGMIRPNMATKLCFLCTDLSIKPTILEKIFRKAVNQSFNNITVDGDMSTNDMALLLSNGLAGNACCRECDLEDLATFQDALTYVCAHLAKMIIQDGEGATKMIEISVQGALKQEEAKRAAYAIAESPLVKTSFFGERCLWGRILAAIGYCGIRVNPELVDVYYGPIQIVSKGTGTNQEAEAEKILQQKHINLLVNLHLGSEQAKILTCDLSKEYVTINMGYS